MMTKKYILKELKRLEIKQIATRAYKFYFNKKRCEILKRWCDKDWTFSAIIDNFYIEIKFNEIAVYSDKLIFLINSKKVAEIHD